MIRRLIVAHVSPFLSRPTEKRRSLEKLRDLGVKRDATDKLGVLISDYRTETKYQGAVIVTLNDL